MKHCNSRIQKLMAILLMAAVLVTWSVPSLAATVTATINSDEEQEFPPAVINPALTGQWGFHNEQFDTDVVFLFNEDGTGNYYANGINIPIASYVATEEPYTEYEEDGFLITVYWGEMVMEFDGETITATMSPIEYGYRIEGNTLRITFSRDIANDYIDLTRE